MLWAAISLVMVVLFNLFNQPQTPSSKLSYSDFMQKVNAGDVVSVKIQGHKITGVTTGGGKFLTYAPEDPSLVGSLMQKKVEVMAEPEEDSPWYMTLLVSWFPMLLLVGVWIFFMRQMQNGGGRAMNFGRSRARMITQEQTRVTFEDVAGVDEAKEELTEVVQFLSDPKKFTRLGGRIPKGVLLVGSPGTGKTLLARAVAGEAGVPFFSISGSEFVEMFVGVGAARVRELFTQAREKAPCIIFIDELDAIGKSRAGAIIGGHDEREQTLNQLLVEMDGFDPRVGVIIMAATNRPETLDPALLRAGRFDRQVLVDKPDVRGREEILEVHARKVTLAPEVELKVIARKTPGFSGADLANVINEAALLAARKNKDAVEMADLEEAVDRIMGGLEKKNRVINPKEKKIVAYHETGHALVASFTAGADEVHKISIVPRGIGALGWTQQLPTEDRYLMTKTELLGKIDVLLGGRGAERLVFGDVSTGAHNDLQRATDIARAMVAEYGMGQTLGPATYPRQSRPVFLTPDQAPLAGKEYSEATAAKLDVEVKEILEASQARVTELLTGKQQLLEKIATRLLEKEVLDEAEFKALLAEPEAA